MLAVAWLLADPPFHSLPWYFGAVAFGIWAAAALGFAVIVRRRVRARTQRRRPRPGRRDATVRSPVRQNRSLGPGSDLEPFE